MIFSCFPKTGVMVYGCLRGLFTTTLFHAHAHRLSLAFTYSATAQWKTTAQRLITSHRRPYRQQYLASRASTPACGFGAALRNCTEVIYWPHIAGLSRLSAPCTLEQCSLGRLILPPLPHRTAKHKWPCPWPESNRPCVFALALPSKLQGRMTLFGSCCRFVGFSYVLALPFRAGRDGWTRTGE